MRLQARSAGFRLLSIAFALALAGSRAWALEDEEELPPLKEGESIHSDSFDIDASGHFTYERTVRRTVGYLGLEVRLAGPEDAARLKSLSRNSSVGPRPSEEASGEEGRRGDMAENIVEEARRSITPPQPAEARRGFGIGSKSETLEGVVVVAVDRDSPAARAGLLWDDLLLLYRGQPIRSMEQFGYLVEDTPPGSSVVIEGLREGKRQGFLVAAGSRNRITASRATSRRLPLLDDRDRSGLVLAEVPPGILPLLGPPGAPGGGGLLLADILPGGPAFFTAARRGDLLLEIAGRPTPTLADYRSAMTPAPWRANMVLLRDGKHLEITLRLEKEATRIREFNFPLSLVSFERRPEKKKLTLLWGFLFSSRTSHRISHSRNPEEHLTDKSVGLLCNLFRYSSSPRKSELRLLWLFPFRFTSESDRPD